MYQSSKVFFPVKLDMQANKAEQSFVGPKASIETQQCTFLFQFVLCVRANLARSSRSAAWEQGVPTPAKPLYSIGQKKPYPMKQLKRHRAYNPRQDRKIEIFILSPRTKSKNYCPWVHSMDNFVARPRGGKKHGSQKYAHEKNCDRPPALVYGSLRPRHSAVDDLLWRLETA